MQVMEGWVDPDNKARRKLVYTEYSFPAKGTWKLMSHVTGHVAY